MMTTNSRDQKAKFPAAKQETSTGGSGGGGGEKLIKAPSSTSSRQWSSAGFRNPRIVRVSRTFGGKDRHSKVCTVRGLRDRRIRLSVPTAVQLYDLQDRLGLSQPSKVIDWLIDATKTDIDKLPPLQFPQGALLGQFHHQHLLIPDLHHDSIATTTTAMKSNEQDHQFAQKLFGMSSYMNYFHNSDHQPSPNLSLSQYGLGQFALPQLDGSSSHGSIANNTSSSSSSSSSTSSSSSSSFNPHLFFCAQPNPTTSLFAPYPQYLPDHHHQQINHHDHSTRSSSSLSQMMNHNNHNIQLLTSGANLISTSSSQHNNHALSNYSLMSSLHNSNAENSPPNLNKSFPAIFNPRLFSQSSFENRPGKGHDT